VSDKRIDRSGVGWVRLDAPPERPAPGVTASRVAVAVLPATAAVIVLRRRARRRAVASAWRARTYGEVSAENRRVVDALDAGDSTPRKGRLRGEDRA
jgi:hypothetical protein